METYDTESKQIYDKWCTNLFSGKLYNLFETYDLIFSFAIGINYVHMLCICFTAKQLLSFKKKI